MSNGNPWGNTSPDNGGGTVGQYGASQNAQSNGATAFTDGNGNYVSSDGQTYSPNDPTGLSGEKNQGHTWGITDLWGGDNKYADWSLTPSSFAPQGDSNAFYDSLAKQYAGRNADQIAGAYGGANQAWNQYQQNMGNVKGSMGLLANAAAGNAPSQAQIQQQQGIQQSISAQQALANSARGGPGAWAAQQQAAMRQGASMQQSGIQQGMAQRAAEMAQARGQYAQMAQGAGNMSLQAQQQMGQYGQGFEKQNDASMLGLLGYGQQAGVEADKQENAWNNVVSGATSNNAGNANSATGATVAAIGTAAAAMSDARAKRLIVPEGHERGAYERSASEEMLDQLRPVSFNYKPGTGENPASRRFGVMAQDLERSRMGKSLVMDTPVGKHIDVIHAMGAALATMADMNTRIKNLERGGRHG